MSFLGKLEQVARYNLGYGYMKNMLLVKYFVPVVAVLALGTSEMYGTDGSWNVDTGGNWSNSGNWTSDPSLPGGAGSVVNLTYDITATRIVTIDTTPRTVGILNIGDSNASDLFTLAASGGGYLILDNDGSAAQINMGAGGGVNANVITAPLRLTTHGVVINNTSGGNRVINGAISTDTAGLKLITVHSSGGNTTFNGIISDGSGQVGVLYDAGGVGFLSGNNTFSGGITIQSGSIRATHDNGFGAGAITLGNASSGTSVVSITSTGTRVTANKIIVSSDASSANISISTTINNSNVKYTGDIELQRNVVFNTASGNSKLEFSGKLLGSGNLEIQNTGGNADAVTVLSGDNSGLTGNITATTPNIHLALGHANALGNGSTVTLGGTNLRLSSEVSNLVVDSNAAVVSTANFAFIGDYDMTIKNDVSLTSNRTIDVASGRTLGLGGAISGGSVELIKNGAGTLVLDGTNTYTSDTQVNAGILQGSGSVAGNVYIADGATLSNAGGEFTVGGGDLGFDDGAIFHFTLDTTTSLAAKIITGSITLDGDVVFSFQETGSTFLTEGTVFTPFDTTTFTGEFAGLTEGSIVSGGVNSYKVSYLGGGGFTLEVIPEPGTLALLAFGGLVALAFRRRRP